LPPVPLRGLHLEAAGNERKEVGADGLGLRELKEGALACYVVAFEASVRDRLPGGRRFEAQFEASFEIRLIEDGEGDAGAIGDEERVEKIVVPVEGAVPGDEIDLDEVFSRRGGKD
jgi:hypothetical protein